MPKYTPAERQLRHLKGIRLKTGVGLPKPNEGSDGELTLRRTKSGLKLLCKFGNKWYGIGDQSLKVALGPDLDRAGDGSNAATTINSRTGNLNMAGTIAMSGATPRGGITGYDSRSSLPLSSAINSSGVRSKGLRFNSLNDNLYIQDVHMSLEDSKRLIFNGSTATTYMTGTNTSLSTLVGGNTKISIDTSTTPDQVNIQNADMYLKATSISATGNNELIFLTQRGADGSIAAGQDLDDLGKIAFKGYNDAGTPELIEYGYILGEIGDASDGDESGQMKISTGYLELNSSGDMLFDIGGGDLTIQDDNSGKPKVLIKSAHGTNNASGPFLQFLVDRTGSYSSADNDILGYIQFTGENSDTTLGDFASIIGSISDNTAGSELGKLELGVITEAVGGNDMATGLSLIGTTTNGRIDATICKGVTSQLTVSGIISVTGTKITGTNLSGLTLDSAGDVILDAANGRIKFYDAGDDDDYGIMSVNGGTGATTFGTISDGADGHLTLSPDGDLIFDNATGNFSAKRNGTLYSVEDSAYAGMILGYRCIGENASHASYTLTTSFAVPHADMTIRFVAPPSGAVEIMVQILMNSSTSNKSLSLGLSDNATYNTIGVQYEQIAQFPDENDDMTIQHYWTVTGLTAGTTYNYWLGAKTSGTTKWLNWGGNASGRYPEFIMKAVALPKSASDFAEYG